MYVLLVKIFIVYKWNNKNIYFQYRNQTGKRHKEYISYLCIIFKRKYILLCQYGILIYTCCIYTIYIYT